MIELVRDSIKYRELIWALALKELKIRYKRSVLGFLWALLNPLLLMLVLTVVFSNLMGANIPHYAIFLLSVLLPWTFFAQSLAYAAESIVGNADLIKKVRVAKSVFPMAAVVSNMINLFLSLIPLVLIVLILAAFACTSLGSFFPSRCSRSRSLRSGRRSSSQRSTCSIVMSRTSSRSCCRCGSMSHPSFIPSMLSRRDTGGCLS